MNVIIFEDFNTNYNNIQANYYNNYSYNDSVGEHIDTGNSSNTASRFFCIRYAVCEPELSP